ncbi:hypothetical protein FO519_009815 [Halicephalobus sp. NKZ332]|nr:hypothetical protein FO519_009815 [Halicephalobus sp. NKZ332]
MKLLIFLALVGLTTAAVYQHSLTWRESKRSKLIKSGQWPTYLKYKELMRSVKANGKFSNLKSVGQKVSDYDNCDPRCCNTKKHAFKNLLSNRDACDYKRKFDSTKSSTYVKNGQQWEIEYDLSEGILGLAFTSLSVSGAVPPLINAVNQGLLDKPLFTVYLRQRGNQENVPGGVFTYGAVDTQNCGDVIAYEKLTSASYFQFRIQKVGLGSYSSSAGWEAISNTGSYFIQGPKGVTDLIASTAGAIYDDFYGTYKIDCKADFAPLTITIGKNTYQVDKKQLLATLENGKCELALSPSEFGGFHDTWVLGDPWIRQYCNIYSFDKQIGFAPTKK